MVSVDGFAANPGGREAGEREPRGREAGGAKRDGVVVDVAAAPSRRFGVPHRTPTQERTYATDVEARE
jgi:hypothetical protein